MAHWVLRRGRYWSLEESYRENGKVKKRVLRYLGSIVGAPLEDIVSLGIFKHAPEDRASIAAERAMEKANAEAEVRERQEPKELWSQEKFLEQTRVPAEEKGPADVAEPVEPTHASESEQPSLPSDEPASSETSGSTPQGE